MHQYAGYIFMAASAVAASILGPFSRYCFTEGVTAMEMTFWRLVIAGSFFFIHARIARQSTPTLRAMGIFAIFGICSIALLSASFLLSLKIAGITTTVVLVYTAPAWVALFSRFLFKEPLPPLKLAALAFALFGATLACLSGGALPGGVSMAGMALALFCGLVLACQYISLSILLKTVPAAMLFSIAMPAGAMATFPFVSFSMHPPSIWLCILFIGIACSYLNFMAYAAGIKRLPPTTAAVIANLEPILAALFAWVWWDESFPLQGWIGASFVVAAVFLVILSGKPSGKKTP